MNKMWIRAKICEVISHCEDGILYSEIIAHLDPSCHTKDIIQVLAQMYHERHIYSNHGVVKWDRHGIVRCESVGVLSLCKMIAVFVGEGATRIEWGVGSEVNCHGS